MNANEERRDRRGENRGMGLKAGAVQPKTSDCPTQLRENTQTNEYPLLPNTHCSMKVQRLSHMHGSTRSNTQVTTMWIHIHTFFS